MSAHPSLEAPDPLPKKVRGIEMVWELDLC